LKYIILSINGDYEKKSIREFVDNEFLAMDSREFRKHIKQMQPDVNLSVTIETSNGMEDVEIPINLNFFWPDASI
jgi:predicted component of type VI protein secretion system